jgi:transcription elongation factor/antiterminator RfaH
MSEIVTDVARWYAIHTHTKQEDRAESNLRVLGIQVFNPRIKESRRNQYTSLISYITKPFFPRYIFAQFVLSDLYQKVRFTRGVYNIVSFGENPTPIDGEMIRLIQSNLGEDGFVKIGDSLKLGDKVVVKDGPLKNFTGVFVREMKDVDRIRILLQTVSYQAHVEIERRLVKRAGENFRA